MVSAASRLLSGMKPLGKITEAKIVTSDRIEDLEPVHSEGKAYDQTVFSERCPCGKGAGLLYSDSNPAGRLRPGNTRSGAILAARPGRAGA